MESVNQDSTGRCYSLNEQRQKNEILAANINSFWEKKGIKANARVEEKRIVIPKISKAPFKSFEIVSNVQNFPWIKREYMGIE